MQVSDESLQVPEGGNMLKLQVQVLNKWVPVGEGFLFRIPENCDALAWVRAQFPESDWRVALVRD